MGYRELFLALLSVILLSTITLRINANAVQAREVLQQIEMQHVAATVAQQFLEEAKSKKFDTQIGFIPLVSMPALFTPAANLGPEIGETYPAFDDVDDYEAYNDTLFVNGLDFIATIDVVYVTDLNPNLAVLLPTFFKRMTVTVSSRWLPAGSTPISRHIFTYFGANL